MVQIEKKKKKGRPSKADLEARRRGGVVSADLEDSEQQQRDLRRSLRRRSFRYNIIDYDEDYLDDGEVLFEEEGEEEEYEDEDDEERREKKVKLVVKLNGGGGESHSGSHSRGRRGTSRDSVTRPGRKGRRRTSRDSDEEEDDDDEVEERVLKKLRVSRKVEEDEDDEEDDVDDDVDDDVVNGGNDEGRERKGEAKREDYNVPGTPPGKEDEGGEEDDDQILTPLPDKKQLEIVLDKLQKKDTYGVYAEPVDPDELPDYHEVIEHPMDFSTVRKKLADGSYSTLEEFESDVFLISSNAMQYNAADTIYHKQARIIKELAEKKFQRIRIRIQRLEQESKSEPKSEPKSESKSEQKDRACSLVKKLIKKPLCGNTLEPVVPDFSSGASLATSDVYNGYKADHGSNSERPGNSNGVVEPLSFVVDHNIERVEDPQSGKGMVPKFGRRSFVVDENRRATYNTSNQPVEQSESIFTTFEGDKKQLIPVGLSGEFSYARSLARFAANLGPPAWKVASKRIEQVLPPGFKYGRGWIGEYEPLPTAVFVFAQRKDPFVSRSYDMSDSIKRNNLREGQVPAAPQLFRPHSSDGKCETVFSSGGIKPPTSTVPVPQHIPILGASGGPANMMLKRVESNCSSANNHETSSLIQQQGRISRDTSCSETAEVRRPGSNSPSISNLRQDNGHRREHPHGMEVSEKRAEPKSSLAINQRADILSQKQPRMEIPGSRPVETAPMGTNFLQSPPFKLPDSNGGLSAGLANGKLKHNAADSIRVSTSSPGMVSSHPAGPATSYLQRQDQGLSDPVLVMKMLTEKAQRQQNGSAHHYNPLLARPSVPSPRADVGGNAAAVAASAWMSVGAVGFRPSAQNPTMNQRPVSAEFLHNGTRMFYPQAMPSGADFPVSATMQLQPEKKGLPFQAFAPQPSKGNSEAQVQNGHMGFPQLATNDLSRFQMQAHWRGLSPHTQQKQKQDSLPPDLNVAFQSPTDSQQPDLALQL